MKLDYLVATVIDGWYVTTNGIVATAKPARKQKGRGPERMKERLEELWVDFHENGIPQDDRLVVIQAEELSRLAELAEELTKEHGWAAAMLSNGKALIVSGTNRGDWRLSEIKCSSQGEINIFINVESLKTIANKSKGTLTIREMAHVGAGFIKVDGEKCGALAMEIRFDPGTELSKAINWALKAGEE